MDDKIEKLSDALLVMQDMMLKKGVFEPQQEMGKSIKPTGKNKQGNKVDKSSGSSSVTTIYQNSVEKVLELRVVPQQLILRNDPEISFKTTHLRDSTSSEDQVDTSDELIDIDLNNVVGGKDKARQPNEGGRQPAVRMVKDKGDDALKEAEAAKARMYATPGEETSDMVDRFLNDFRFKQLDRQQCTNHPSALVDENYLVMGSHLDQTMIDKIVSGQYINFARLLPKDKAGNDDNRMEIVSQGGSTFFVPVLKREAVRISDFNRWEQAFRIYANVYIRHFPTRASELIQYNQVIFTAAKTFVWENAYRYDKEFCMYLGHYPHRSWAIILQQAWSMYLKDCLRSPENNFGGGGKASPGSRNKKEICKTFNKGKCTSGSSCRYDHRCLGCGKFGHRMHICRNKDKQSAGTTSAMAHGSAGEVTK